MRFEYLQTRQVRIDARIRSRDGFTRLQFYEPGSQTLKLLVRMGLFQQLRRARGAGGSVRESSGLVVSRCTSRCGNAMTIPAALNC